MVVLASEEAKMEFVKINCLNLDTMLSPCS